MKKVIGWVLTGITLCMVCGCGKTSNVENSQPEEAVSETVADTVEETDIDDTQETESEEVAESEQVDETEDPVEEEPFTNEDYSYVNDEGYIVFGSYEQDGDTSNGPEPIEWILLEETGGRRLLISRYVLDYMPYNSDRSSAAWSDSDLRNWLNEDFYNQAFNEEEKGQIRIVSVPQRSGTPFNINGRFGASDKVFCLGAGEIYKCYEADYFNDDTVYGFYHQLIAEATPYAVSNGAVNSTITSDSYSQWLCGFYAEEDCVGLTGTSWWMADAFNECAAYVGRDGDMGTNSNYICFVTESRGVRPAIYIK